MKRLITALGLLAFAVYSIFFAPQPVFYGIAVLVALLCYREYVNLVKGHGILNPGVFGIAGGVLVLFWPQFTLPAIALVMLAAYIWALRANDLKSVLPFVAAAVLGVFYTWAPWRFAAELRGISVHILFFALALNWAGDSIAYYVGRSIGKHRLAPVVSPKKSVEGAAAAVIGSVVFGVIYLHYTAPQVVWWEVAVIAAIANVAGQFGDLAESALKRGAGVKDSGQMLPGHGGMLDRLDSSLFALPTVYVLLRFFSARA